MNELEPPVQGEPTRGRTSGRTSRDATSMPLLDRILHSIRNRKTGRVSPAMGEAQHVLELCGVMLSERGEVSGVRLAGEVLLAYQVLVPAAREAFFALLGGSFLPDPELVAAAATDYQREPSTATLSRLQAAVESPR